VCAESRILYIRQVKLTLSRQQTIHKIVQLYKLEKHDKKVLTKGTLRAIIIKLPERNGQKAPKQRA
jgi:hypothetical protein